MTKPTDAIDMDGLRERAKSISERLNQRQAKAPNDNTKVYIKACAEPDGSMGWGYDAELDSRADDLIRDLLAAIDEQQRVVERLPVAADGVRVVPEDVLYVAGTVSGHIKVRVTMLALGPLGRVFISDCYSTSEAALAARKDTADDE